MVLRFDGVIQSPQARRQEQSRGRVETEFGVVQDVSRVHLGSPHAGLDAVGLGVPSETGGLGGGERRGDGDVKQPFLGGFVDPVRYGLGRVDGGTSADGDDGVDGGVPLDLSGGPVELGHGGVFTDVTEGTGVAAGRSQQRLDGLDQGCLGGQGIARDDEGL